MTHDNGGGELGAKLENGFCVQSDCVNWFEDVCSLCYICDNKYVKIYPFNLENAGEDIENKCDYYKKGISKIYLYELFKG